MRPKRLKLKSEPRAQPVFGPKFGCKVSHFTVQYGGERAACAPSGSFKLVKTSARRILIIDSETLTGAHSPILGRDANHFGRTLVGRRTRRTTDGHNAGATQHNRDAPRIRLTDRLSHETTSSFRPPPADLRRPHKTQTSPIYTQ